MAKTSLRKTDLHEKRPDAHRHGAADVDMANEAFRDYVRRVSDDSRAVVARTRRIIAETRALIDGVQAHRALFESRKI